jgi:GNAT superfamily N-acetyltransferase
MPATEPVIVRPCRTEDAAAINRLLLYLDEFHAAARPDMFQVPSGDPRGRGFIDDIVADPEQALILAECDGDVVGLIQVALRSAPDLPASRTRRFAMIDAAVVAPDAQNKGIGKRLLEAAIAWAEQHGVFEQQIAVHEFNEPARNLYRGAGFTPSITILRRLSDRPD